MITEDYKRSCMDVIYLASCVVKENKPDIERVEGMDLNNLYAAADRHLLTAIICISLESVGVKNDAFVQAKAKAIRKIILLDNDRNALLQKLEQNGIWYMTLKGSVLKDYYPVLGMRQMSDNDILFDASRAEDVRIIMTDLGFTTETYGTSSHDVYYKLPVSNFEMHRALFGPEHEKRLMNYYADVKSRLVKDKENDYGFHFTPEDFYIYITAHEYKHFSLGGTGLRSLLDIYVFLKRFGNVLDWKYIGEELDKLGLTNFEKQNRNLAQRLFNGEDLTDYDRETLDYILDSGIYGTMKHRVENEVKKRGKIGYFFSRAFLPYRTMCIIYPVLKKVPVLLPFFWVVRWIDALIKRPSKAFYQVKTAINTENK